jgi:hypothetical protein
MWPFRRRAKKDIYLDGQNLTLVRETRWLRHYKGGRFGSLVDSRFRDGSAAITLTELAEQWPDWNGSERQDFCLAFMHGDVPERRDILRYLIRNGDSSHHATIALPIAIHLLSEESFPILKQWCETAPIGKGANFFQAMGMTKSADAAEVLQRCLARVWASPDLMDTSDFCNWTAFDAICCMAALLHMGVDPESLRPQFEQLKTHPFSRTRTQAEQHIGEFFT